MADAKEPGRRDALRAMIGVGGAAFGCALAGPAAVFVIGPSRGGSGAGRWVHTVKVDALTEGQPQRVAIIADQHEAWTLTKNVELGAVWLVRRGDTVTAWTATCPHLGCAISAGTDTAFLCPCHQSTFDANGKRDVGPSPRDMDTLATKIEDGVVVVDFREFRTGTPDKIEVG